MEAQVAWLQEYRDNDNSDKSEDNFLLMVMGLASDKLTSYLMINATSQACWLTADATALHLVVHQKYGALQRSGLSV